MDKGKNYWHLMHINSRIIKIIIIIINCRLLISARDLVTSRRETSAAVIKFQNVNFLRNFLVEILIVTKVQNPIDWREKARQTRRRSPGQQKVNSRRRLLSTMTVSSRSHGHRRRKSVQSYKDENKYNIVL
ncbi:hypothetical protein T08_15580 [Trichinella sp. T8]|nr:hypothetical protein T08_15580 [Trichinella sp. T8]